MSALAESIAQKARLAGAKATLRSRGRIVKLSSNNEEDDEVETTATVDDLPGASEPSRPAQQQSPVYTVLSCLAGGFEDPRSIVNFYEVKAGRNHKVIEFIETAGDRIWWKWRCEAQREQFS